MNILRSYEDSALFNKPFPHCYTVFTVHIFRAAIHPTVLMYHLFSTFWWTSTFPVAICYCDSCLLCTLQNRSYRSQGPGFESRPVLTQEYWFSGLVNPTARKLFRNVGKCILSMHHWRNMFKDEFSNGPKFMWQVRHWPTLEKSPDSKVLGTGPSSQVPRGSLWDLDKPQALFEQKSSRTQQRSKA